MARACICVEQLLVDALAPCAAARARAERSDWPARRSARAPARPASERRPCPPCSRWIRSSGVRSTSSMASARSRIESGTVSRTRTPVICATTSLRLSMCWMLTRRVDVDAAAQELLDIEIALGMPAARRIGVGELVDERRVCGRRAMRASRSISSRPVVLCTRCRRRGMTSRPSSRASVSLRPCVSTTPTTTSAPSFLLGPRLLQHLVGLADARSGTKEDLEPADAAFLASGCLRASASGEGRWSRLTPLICHEASVLARCCPPALTACRRDPEQD